MKYLLSIWLLTASFTALSQTKADNIIGKWTNEDGAARFEIYKAGNEYRGKITWLKDPRANKATDQKNPDKSLRSRPLIGIDILTGLSYSTASNNWTGGKIYTPEKGAYADCTVIWVDSRTIKIEGRKFGMSKTKVWKRYEE